MAGPTIRTDIVDVYVFRIPAGRAGAGGPSAAGGPIAGAQFLQMRRVRGPMPGTWQPVMGHVEPGQAGGDGETAVDAALRELSQETGYAPGAALMDFWQVESVNTYFLASENCVMMSPCFAAQVAADVPPVPDAAHDGFRWVRRDEVDRMFLWPGQRLAIGQIVRDILPAVVGDDGAAVHARPSVADLVRIDLDSRRRRPDR